MSTFLELKRAFYVATNTGKAAPVVKFKRRIEDMESYFDQGMAARVSAIRLVERYPEDEGGGLYEVVFDISEFDKHKTALELANYYDEQGVPCLTATESGNKPANGKESVYFMEYGDVNAEYFDIVKEQHLPETTVFPDQEAHAAVQQAVFLYKSILEARVGEASKSTLGNADKDASQAQAELNALLRAEQALKN